MWNEDSEDSKEVNVYEFTIQRKPQQEELSSLKRNQNNSSILMVQNPGIWEWTLFVVTIYQSTILPYNSYKKNVSFVTKTT